MTISPVLLECHQIVSEGDSRDFLALLQSAYLMLPLLYLKSALIYDFFFYKYKNFMNLLSYWNTVAVQWEENQHKKEADWKPLPFKANM